MKNICLTWLAGIVINSCNSPDFFWTFKTTRNRKISWKSNQWIYRMNKIKDEVTSEIKDIKDSIDK